MEDKRRKGGAHSWAETGGLPWPFGWSKRALCAFLPTLQQEAESVLAQRDDWRTGNQASRSGQVSWWDRGCVWGTGGRLLLPPLL